MVSLRDLENLNQINDIEKELLLGDEKVRSIVLEQTDIISANEDVKMNSETFSMDKFEIRTAIQKGFIHNQKG